jgi:hypothetical protein
MQNSASFRATIAEMSQVLTVLKNVPKKDKLLGAIFAGGKTVVISFGRTFYALWLQVTGLFFILFSIFGIRSLVHQYRTNHFADRVRFWEAVVFLTVSLWFTLVSFRKANRTLKK